MRWRWLPWIALGVVLVTALVIGSGSRAGPQSAGQRVDAIARNVRCPSCSGLSVAESDAPTALAIRQLITNGVRAGRSDSSIDAELVRSYGSGILLRPAASGVGAVVWVVPALAGAVAVTALVVVFRRRRIGRDQVATASAEDRALVERALR